MNLVSNDLSVLVGVRERRRLPEGDLGPRGVTVIGRKAYLANYFSDTLSPDYQAILRTFEPVAAELRQRPRMDMPGAKPANVDRSCLGVLQNH